MIRNGLNRSLAVLAALVLGRVTAAIVAGYSDYFPPDFQSEFLHGRGSYFFGGYHWAFYAHLFAGPITLLLGMLLISTSIRTKVPRWHRRLGKLQIALVIGVLAPSGLWMARYADGGPIAAWGFAGLATATGSSALLGWRTAVQRRFPDHERWMWRCFVLLCSAVVLRVIGGLSTVTGIGSEWSYPLAAWASWLVPLAAFELLAISRRGPSRQDHSSPSSGSLASSPPSLEIIARS